MSDAALELGFAAASLALRYGIPMAVDIVSTWKDGLNGREPTTEDFEALRVADPESFFNAGPDER